MEASGPAFGSIPYATVHEWHHCPISTNLSEFRLSMQNSRIGFRVDADVTDAHVIGYMEADFLGTPASTNIAVTNNAQLLRNRLYWVDLRKGAWEVLGGQTWSLITPGRSGISPLPADIFYSQDIDVNYQAGLFWGRIPELRVRLSPLEAGGLRRGASTVLTNMPEVRREVAPSSFPPALPHRYAGELDFGASSGGIATPNVAPDFIAKLALGSQSSGFTSKSGEWSGTSKSIIPAPLPPAQPPLPSLPALSRPKAGAVL